MKILFLSLLVKNTWNRKIQGEEVNEYSAHDILLLQFLPRSLSFHISGYQPFVHTKITWGDFRKH